MPVRRVRAGTGFRRAAQRGQLAHPLLGRDGRPPRTAPGANAASNIACIAGHQAEPPSAGCPAGGDIRVRPASAL